MRKWRRSHDVVFMFLVGLVIAFMIGMIYGVYGCKHDYGIPRGTHPNDGEWLTHEVLGEIYGRYHNRNTVSTEQ